MRIIGIETSCDDTAIALIEAHDETINVIKETTASQIDIHKIYGGVVPEVAARAHTESMIPLLHEIYDTQHPPDAIAVTAGPGLITSLIVGVETAKTIATLENIPLIAVNHMEGHIYANWINADPIEFPVLALIVSGGHTELVSMKNHLTYKKIGWTVDDAAGEAFDKIGKLIGLDYPGGPKISHLAQMGNPHSIPLPRPMLDSDDLNFSFSGLKTAAKLYIEKHPTLCDKKNETERSHFCASLQQAIVDVLIKKTIKAIHNVKPKTALLGGGVAANKQLRQQLSQAIDAYNNETPQQTIQFCAPNLAYTTDNAAMIATAGYFKAIKKEFVNPNELTADPAWELPTLHNH